MSQVQFFKNLWHCIHLCPLKSTFCNWKFWFSGKLSVIYPIRTTLDHVNSVISFVAPCEMYQKKRRDYDSLPRSTTAPIHYRMQSSRNSPKPWIMIQSVNKRRTIALVSVSAKTSEKIRAAWDNIILESFGQTDMIYECAHFLGKFHHYAQTPL